jgi:hypothetical protein
MNKQNYATSKFWVTSANKDLTSRGIKYKFAISTNQNFFGSDVFFFLNPISLLKNSFHRLKNPMILDDIYDSMTIEFVPRKVMSEASEIIFGIDGNIRKATILNKKKGIVIKFIQFQTVKKAYQWIEDYEIKLKKFNEHINLTKVNGFNFEDVVGIGCLGSTVQITSIYKNNLTKVRLFDIPSLASLLMCYIASAKSKMKHADLKIYNIRKTKNGEFFIFDLESLSDQLTDIEMYKIFIEPYESNRFYSLSSFLAYIYIKFKFKIFFHKKMKNI